MLEMLCDHSLTNTVFIILVVVLVLVCTAEQIFLLQCLQKTWTFILTGYREYLYISVCI